MIETLVELYKSNPKYYCTDKETEHTYLSVYDKLFGYRKNEKLTILEIGIYEYAGFYDDKENKKFGGGSLRLWADYFPKSNVVGIDLRRYCEFKNKRIHQLTGDVKKIDDFKFTEFDIIIDDASHNLNDQIFSVKKFYPMLKEDGLLIIEDVQQKNYIEEFKKIGIPFQIVDNTYIKSRYDDILLVYRALPKKEHTIQTYETLYIDRVNSLHL